VTNEKAPRAEGQIKTDATFRAHPEMPQTTTRRFVTIKYGAEVADTHPKTIQRWIASGLLPAYKVGPRVIRIDLDELLALFEPVGVSTDMNAYHDPRCDLPHRVGQRALWQIEVGHSLRELDVIATGAAAEDATRPCRELDRDGDSYMIKAPGIRIRDMYCCELAMAEREAVELSAVEARRLACALLAAAEEFETFPGHGLKR
jgi:excisionase family DNA binding protein